MDKAQLTGDKYNLPLQFSNTFKQIGGWYFDHIEVSPGDFGVYALTLGPLFSHNPTLPLTGMTGYGKIRNTPGSAEQTPYPIWRDGVRAVGGYNNS